MSELADRIGAPGADPYEAGKRALQDAVIAAGGLWGLFDQLCSNSVDDLQPVLNRLRGLLSAAASPEDRERNRQAIAERCTGDGLAWMDEVQLAAVERGISPTDAAAFLLAWSVTSTAFPELDLDDISARGPGPEAAG